MYLRIKNETIEYPYTLLQLRRDENTVSFPQTITNDILEVFGVYVVMQTPKPNDYTKTITEGTPNLVDGVYYQNWVMEDSTESEIQSKIEYKWDEIRNLRTELLKECDWRVLPDSPVGDSLNNWIQYRQELRNITSQENPFNIVWPIEP
jgi:hypothetical protein